MRPRIPCALATRPTARSAAMELPPGRLGPGLLRQLDQLGDRRAGLRAHLQPMLQPVLLEMDARGAVVRIVGADLLVEAPVARISRVGCNYVIERRFLRTPTGEAQLDGHGRSSLKKRRSLHGGGR